MDIYLVEKDGKYLFLTDPCQELSADTRVLDVKLDVNPHQADLAKLNMLEPAALDMYRRAQDHEFLPDRVYAYQSMNDQFASQVPSFFQINWTIWKNMGTDYLIGLPEILAS